MMPLRVLPLATLALAACLCRPQAVAAAEAADAVAVVAGLHSALVEVAGLEPPRDVAERTRLLAGEVAAAHDFARMGRLTVRRFWGDWSEAERQSFLEVFERFSVATYASRFGGVGPDTFEIVGSEAIRDDQAEVNSRIQRREGAAVALDYTLSFDGERWRIVSVLADGASELSLMAAEYYDILQAGNLEDLIAVLEARIAEF
jgi:phospholipid transport system substrate-binding protein